MHTQHLIGRIKLLQREMNSISEHLREKNRPLDAQELAREAKHLDQLVQSLRADL